MIARERHERTQTEIRIAGATCDRCGSELRHGSGFVPSSFPFDGVYVRGLRFPDSHNAAEIEKIEAELCGRCSLELLAWIGPGAYVGTKGRDLT